MLIVITDKEFTSNEISGSVDNLPEKIDIPIITVKPEIGNKLLDIFAKYEDFVVKFETEPQKLDHIDVNFFISKNDPEFYHFL